MHTVAEIFHSHEQIDTEGRHIGGTDKHGPNHSYGDAYENIISRYFGHRNKVELMMEVGVADGACMLAWREIFPNALIVGMDIHPSALAYGDRLEFHLGDQRNKHDCERAARWGDRQFDLIVEDATHELEATLLTFLYLWPFVKPGGLYVIEEFANVGSLRGNIHAMWPSADIVDTKGPHGGGIEPLVVFRKPVQ